MKKYRNPHIKPGSGRKFTLAGSDYWAVLPSEIEDWQGPGIAIPDDLMLGLAQRIDTQMKLGASRKEAEEYARDWLEEQLGARKSFGRP